MFFEKNFCLKQTIILLSKCTGVWQYSHFLSSIYSQQLLLFRFLFLSSFYNIYLFFNRLITCLVLVFGWASKIPGQKKSIFKKAQQKKVNIFLMKKKIIHSTYTPSFIVTNRKNHATLQLNQHEYISLQNNYFYFIFYYNGGKINPLVRIPSPLDI